MSVTIIIIVITCAVSLLGFYNKDITSKLIFDPYLIKHKNQWWRFVTCGLLHGDFFHLFVNMFVLYSFGRVVEYYYGFPFGDKAAMLYVVLYITSIFAANVSTYYKYRDTTSYRSLGASGGVSAVLFASIIFNPYQPLYLYGIIAIPGIIFGAIYLGYSYYMSKRQGDHINHEAHFYGAVYGILFTIVLKPSLFLNFIHQLMMRGS